MENIIIPAFALATIVSSILAISFYSLWRKQVKETRRMRNKYENCSNEREALRQKSTIMQDKDVTGGIVYG